MIESIGNIKIDKLLNFIVSGHGWKEAMDLLSLFMKVI